MLANVYLLESNFLYDEKYTYKIPEAFEDKVKRGVFVDLPFGQGNRIVRALVWELVDSYEGNYTLKEIREVLDFMPLTEKQMDLALAMDDKYLCTLGEAANCMLPPAGNKGRMVRYAKLKKSKEEVENLILEDRFRQIQQIRVLESLYEGPMKIRDMMRDLAISVSPIKTLERLGYIETSEILERDLIQVKEREPSQKPLVLNDEQEEAYRKLVSLIDRGSFQEALLKGITGSGKTEVYMQLIARVLEENGNSILLVPEISLTPQMVERLTMRFGSKLAILHSRLSDNERNFEWERIRKGQVSIAVGARSCIFAPFDKLSLIIIDEEQEDTYKSNDLSPRYHAGEIACLRAKEDGALVLYGSATPGVTSYYRAKRGEIHLIELNKRAKEAQLPELEIIDMTKELKLGQSIFSKRLLKEMKTNLERGEQTLLFVNRRGFSSNLQCSSCGKSMKCRKCNIPLTYHLKSDRLICHYCGNTIIAPKECPSCHSTLLMGRGLGTEKLEEEIRGHFPEARVVRMDADTTSVKDGHEKLIRSFRDDKADFLVGTQMIAKGHDFPLVTLVGVINTDSLLNVQDYRAHEKAYQLLTQVAGRAGRDKLAGRVLYQAYDVDNYVLYSATEGSYEDFYKNEILIRERLWYPPFCHIGVVSFSGKNDRPVYDLVYEHREVLISLVGKDHIEILGPTRNLIPKINDRYRWRIIIKADRREQIVQLLESYLNHIKNNRSLIKSAISFYYDINPSQLN